MDAYHTQKAKLAKPAAKPSEADADEDEDLEQADGFDSQEFDEPASGSGADDDGDASGEDPGSEEGAEADGQAEEGGEEGDDDGEEEERPKAKRKVRMHACMHACSVPWVCTCACMAASACMRSSAHRSLAAVCVQPSPARHTHVCLQGVSRGDKGGLAGGLEVERQIATVAGIMSSSEFASLELTENTRKVCRVAFRGSRSQPGARRGGACGKGLQMCHHHGLRARPMGFIA